MGVCPPMCTYNQLTDGTYDLAWVKRANLLIDELMYHRRNADKPD